MTVMKRLLFILLMVSAGLAAMAQNQLYGKYKRYHDVRYVCITQTMLATMTQTQDVLINGQSITPLQDKIENILIIRSTTKNGYQQMTDDRKTLCKDRSYQLLMEQNREGVYLVKLFRNGGKGLSEFVLYQQTDTEVIFIVLTGRINVADITKLF